jgi:uncharacterized protein
VPASLLDTNVWLAAVFPAHSSHGLAKQVLAQPMPGQALVWCRATQQSFLRLVSTPTVHKAYGSAKKTNRDALDMLDALNALPQVAWREEAPGVYDLWRKLARLDSASPKVWTDAYLAAFALAGGMQLVTLDSDFKNYVSQGLDLRLLSKHGPNV